MTIIKPSSYLDFLLEKISFVEKQDQGRFDEKGVVANVFKKIQSLYHTIRGCIFEEFLIVFRNGCHENHSGDTFETVNPLLTFVTLSSHVVHFENRAW